MKTYLTKQINGSKWIFFTALLITTCCSIQSNAQKFYLKAGGGYIAPVGSSAYNDADPNGLTSIQPSTDISISADGSTATVKSLHGTLGHGYKFGLAGGYRFTDHIATELAVNYFSSNKTAIGKFSSPQANEKEVAYLRGFDFSPTLVLRANNPKFDPYVRAGLIFTGPGKLWIETSVDEPNGGGPGTAIAVRAKTEVISKFSAGAIGAAGMMFHLNQRWSLYAEAEYKAFSITSKNASIKEYTTTATSDGQTQFVPGQQLSDLPVNKKSFTFSDRFSQAGNGTSDPALTRVLPTQKVNVSGLGANVGMIFNFH